MVTKTKTDDGKPVDAETGEILPTATEVVAEALAIFNEDWKGLTLAGKIARITGHVGTIPKRGYNAFHKYNYVTEGDLVGAVRQYLAAAGIIIIPDVIKTKVRYANIDNPLTEVTIEYTVTDGVDSFKFRMPGHGADKGDKGVYKAITGSQKYALMKLFKIETGDDPEQDTKVDERAMASSGPRRQVSITAGTGQGVGRGGHSNDATPTQIHRVSELVKTLEWSREDLAEAVNGTISFDGSAPVMTLTGNDTDAALIVNYLKSLKSVQIGKLIDHMTKATVPEADAGPYG